MKPFERSTEHIRKTVDDGTFPGAALAIGVGDQLYVKETFGKTSYTPQGTPVNEHTLYDMASVTKIMSTTMVTLRLIADGKLDLADPLTMYFGEDMVPEDKRGITIFHLLTHTSGIAAEIRLENVCGVPGEDGVRSLNSADDVAAYLLSVPLAATPGTQVIYSCMGFILLAKLLEKACGKSLDILAKELVFEPLGMKHTGYHPLQIWDGEKYIRPDYSYNTAYTERNAHRPEMIKGCSGPGDWLIGEVHDENAYFQNGVSGNAGVFSDLDDCIRYARMLAGHGTLDGKVFLPRCIFDAAIHNYTPGMDENRGLGFHLANGYYSMSGQFFSQKGFGHNGFTGTHVFVDPDSGLYVVLLLNRVHPTRDNCAHLRTRRVLHTLMACEYEELVRDGGAK